MTFKLDKEQQEKVNVWMNKKKFLPVGTIGGRFTFCFTLTTLGVVIKVKDEVLGDEIDVSDYENW